MCFCRFSDTFDKLSSLDLAQKGISIEFFYTGKLSREMNNLWVTDSAKLAKKTLFVQTFSGRPIVEAQLETVASQYDVPFKDMAVLACGPAPMVEGVQKYAVKMGCAFHKETFLL